jgi:peptidoglycan/LPS O-acetylase OafA/YrhL
MLRFPLFSFTSIFFHLIGSGGAAVPDSLSFIRTHLGFGVPLFFVVSGFSLAYGYFGRLHSEQELSTYFVRRFARIAPLFYAVLVFQLFNVWLEDGVTFSPIDIGLNALFVFNLVPHLAEGIVPASWTIGVEMLFYAVFPLSLLACRSLLRTVLVLLVAIALGTSTIIDLRPFESQQPGFVYHNVVSQLPYFLWGVLVFHVLRSAGGRVPLHMKRIACWIICGAGLLAMYALYKSSTIYMFFWGRGLRSTWDMLWGIPFGLLCLGMALHPSRLISNPVTRYLGKVSFSLYLLHPTVLYKLGKAGVYQRIYNLIPGHPGVAYGVSFLLSLAIITSIASLTFGFIEQPGMAWGKRFAAPRAAPVAT